MREAVHGSGGSSGRLGPPFGRPAAGHAHEEGDSPAGEEGGGGVQLIPSKTTLVCTDRSICKLSRMLL